MRHAKTPRVKLVGMAKNPESITAGMARISRDPTDIPTLIKQAAQQATTARARNERIIFGYGHSSIAEHAVASVAIWDISRLLSRDLVAHRLASYTQQSARYIPFESIPRPFVMPPAIQRASSRDRRTFTVALTQATAVYNELFAALKTHHTSLHPALSDEAIARLATEDARYILPITQSTQVGMTANYREWGLVIRRLLGSPLEEAQLLGATLKQTLQPLAPSLMPDKYMQPEEPYYVNLTQALGDDLKTLISPPFVARPEDQPWIDFTAWPDQGAEIRLANAILWEANESMHQVGEWTDREILRKIILAAMPTTSHRAAPRAFEHVTYDFVLGCSESCLHQLVRHRLMSPLMSTYRRGCSIIVPPAVKAIGIGLEQLYVEACFDLRLANLELMDQLGGAYLLPNGDGVEIKLRINLRELLEFTRLRSDIHAQWEIRALADQMISLVGRPHTIIAELLGGRDAVKAGALPYQQHQVPFTP